MITSLHNFTQLTELILAGTQVTAAGLNELRLALPQCNVVIDPELVRPAPAVATEKQPERDP